jgi:EAL domain-containing protein (putative c-di-GMP-specific phosphodiesterase class I)
MVFQPVFDLEREAIVSFEALARFGAEPERPPSAWFSEAAELGLGVELELSALEAALRRLDDLPEDTDLAVNASPGTVLSPRFVELLEPVAERIVIEITEHVQVDDYDVLVDALAPLRARGARVAIDDVGAGFASLRHILLLRPDIVKLDVSLTHDIADDPVRATLASSLVDFARKIESRVTAEGIETREELDLLRGIGVSYGQGYYLGRPDALALSGKSAESM